VIFALQNDFRSYSRSRSKKFHWFLRCRDLSYTPDIVIYYRAIVYYKTGQGQLKVGRSLHINFAY